MYVLMYILIVSHIQYIHANTNFLIHPFLRYETKQKKKNPNFKLIELILYNLSHPSTTMILWNKSMEFLLSFLLRKSFFHNVYEIGLFVLFSFWFLNKKR